jgi:RNA 3'-terminal phosphate cyclase (ATP)
MIELDGSEGEGGGQIVRSALTLALLTGQPFRLVNIRAQRRKPGLQSQHLTCVKAAAEIGQAQYIGAEIGSRSLYFEPRTVQGGNYRWDIGTAGAVALVLQTVFLPLLLRTHQPSQVAIIGGTHVPHAPCAHYLLHTWVGYLQRLGLEISLELIRPGFYPRGGGQIIAILQPSSQVQSLQLLERPVIDTALIWSACAHLRRSVAERQAHRLRERLQAAGLQTELKMERWQSLSPGSMAAVVFQQTVVPTLLFALGERGKPAEVVADAAADQALSFLRSEAPVDPFAADQLLLPLAFSRQPSVYRTSCITRHLTTNAQVIRRFLATEITINGNEGSPGIVRINPVL